MSTRKERRAGEWLESGLRLLQQGRLDDARRAFERAREQAPGNPDALHLLGVTALQRGDPAGAVELLQQAAALEPRNAAHYANLAYGYVGLNRPGEALAAFERAAALDPRDPDLTLGRGNCLAMMGRLVEAEAVLRQLTERHPHHALGWFNLANALRDQERDEEAREAYRRVTELAPEQADGWIGLGTTMYQLEDYPAALDCYRRAEALDPGHAEAHLGIGMSLLKLGRALDAAQRLKRALELRPEMAEAHFFLGNTYLELRQFDLAVDNFRHAIALTAEPLSLGAAAPARHGSVPPARIVERRARTLSNLGIALNGLERWNEAIASFEQALDLLPEDPATLNNMGVACEKLGRTAQAIAFLEQSLAQDPDYAEALYNLGVICSSQERYRESLEYYEQALAKQPNYAAARINLGHGLLMAGDLARGWENYEWRFRAENPDTPVMIRPFSHREWRGEPLAGKRILVWGEQGVGDEIIFAGAFPEVSSTAAHCVIECAPKLASLFARSFPRARIVGRTGPPHQATGGNFDYQAPAGDLWRWLRPSLESFPRHSGYLAPPPDRAAYWKGRLSGLGAGLKVGFCWRSVKVTGGRDVYYTTLDLWGPVFGAPGVHFINLQYGDCAAELAAARARFGVPLHAFPEVDLFDDLDEAAALTQACDLVIGASTASTILSAALGVPTWLMSSGVDWGRFGTDGYPAFPAITLFHRSRDQSWEDILAQIGARLRQRVAPV